MNSIALGPFAFDGERFAAIAGIFVFLSVSALAASRGATKISSWATLTVLSGIVASRLAYVIKHGESFLGEPSRIFAFWQGGFSVGGVVVSAVFALGWIVLRERRQFPWALTAIASGTFAWFMLITLSTIGSHQSPPAKAYINLRNGRTVSIAERNGRPAIVNLWATWCPPCRREMPMLAEMARNNTGVDFIFANQGETREAIRRYLVASGIELDTILLDSFSSLSRHYRAKGLPTTLMIRRDGSLVNLHLGEISKENLSEAVSSLIAEDH